MDSLTHPQYFLSFPLPHLVGGTLKHLAEHHMLQAATGARVAHLETIGNVRFHKKRGDWARGGGGGGGGGGGRRRRIVIVVSMRDA